MEKVAVVILNWNGRKYLEQFLPFLIKYTPNWVQLIVADNASTDDSIAFLTSNYPTIGLVKNSKNFGFAGGYNEALQKIDATYYVLLNSDVEVSENWLSPLLEQLANDSQLAAVQPLLRDYNKRAYFEYAGAAGGYLDKDYYSFCRGRLFNELEQDHSQYASQNYVAWASGACMLVKSKCFWEVGGFDEQFFAHMEEIDLCLRLKNKGYQIGVNTKAIVYHVGGGTLNKENPFKTYLNFRNNLAIITKNHFSSPLFTMLLWRLLLDGIAGIRCIMLGEFKNLAAILKAHFAYYRWLPSLLRKRKYIKLNRKSPTTDGFYSKSIVWDYFIRKKKRFSELQF